MLNNGDRWMLLPYVEVSKGMLCSGDGDQDLPDAGFVWRRGQSRVTVWIPVKRESCEDCITK
jgi:hypothetical protein